MAKTDLKYFVSSNLNIAQLTNDFGAMLNVLDACLINGVTLPSITSLTVASNIATVTFSAAHQLMKYKEIFIAITAITSNGASQGQVILKIGDL